MTTFDSRENAFEAKFAHDADVRFKVASRRNRLVGMWAAEKLGHAGDAADAYAKTIVAADFEEAGDEDVIRKLVADLAPVGVGEAAIREALSTQAEIARRQVMEAM